MSPFKSLSKIASQVKIARAQLAQAQEVLDAVESMIPRVGAVVESIFELEDRLAGRVDLVPEKSTVGEVWLIDPATGKKTKLR